MLRREHYGIYDQLLVDLRREDPQEFKQFMQMPLAMFDEILEHINHRITKQTMWYRAPLEPGLKLALTLQHLCDREVYRDLV